MVPVPTLAVVSAFTKLLCVLQIMAVTLSTTRIFQLADKSYSSLLKFTSQCLVSGAHLTHSAVFGVWEIARCSFCPNGSPELIWTRRPSSLAFSAWKVALFGRSEPVQIHVEPNDFLWQSFKIFEAENANPLTKKLLPRPSEQKASSKDDQLIYSGFPFFCNLFAFLWSSLMIIFLSF